MTVDDVKEWLEKISDVSDDPETAHGEQDDLYLAVLRAIAVGDVSDPQALAAEAVRAHEIKFDRWYA